jgi:hypothetical protein
MESILRPQYSDAYTRNCRGGPAITPGGIVDPGIRHLRKLAGDGFDVTTAESGRTAPNAWRRDRQPGLVLLDVVTAPLNRYRAMDFRG